LQVTPDAEQGFAADPEVGLLVGLGVVVVGVVL